jgi:mannose-6-phosphate isomerase-like protein (cupin superfamily)
LRGRAARGRAVRHRDGRQRLPLATGIGSARFVDDVTGDEVRAATAFLRTYGNEETYMLDGPDEWDELLVADVHGASAVHAMHGGADVARWKCLARRMGLAGTWEAIEWASLPPGAVCGEHRHTRTEELYFVISGEGEILLDDVPHRIRPGHLVVNGLGTRHQFRNLGDQDLNWLVIEVFGPATAQALVGAGPSAERTS